MTTTKLAESELRAIAEKGNAELGPNATAQELLQWTEDTFGPNYIVASNMQDAVLVQLASQVRPGVDVLFLDTGYHFAETIGTRDAVAATLPVTVRTVAPRQTVAQQDVSFGARLYERNPDMCCALRKVNPRIVLASVFGIAFYGLVALAEHLTTGWHPSARSFTGE